MFCTKCGQKLVEGASFCKMCGASTAGQKKPESAIPAQTKSASPKPKKKISKALLISLLCAVGAIIIAVVLLFVFGVFGGAEADDNTQAGFYVAYDYDGLGFFMVDQENSYNYDEKIVEVDGKEYDSDELELDLFDEEPVDVTVTYLDDDGEVIVSHTEKAFMAIDTDEEDKVDIDDYINAKSLYIYDYEEIFDFDDLEEIEGLNNLYLEECDLLDNLDDIKSLTNLKKLMLYDMSMDDIDEIEELTNLEYLTVIDCYIDDMGGLEKSESLQHLVLEDMDFDLDDIKDAKNIKSLGMYLVDAYNIDALEDMESLEELTLIDVWVDDEDELDDVLDTIEERSVEVMQDNYRKDDEIAAEEPAVEEPAVEEATVAPAEEGYELAMITDIGDIDDKSFNQGTWEGIVEYAEANGITHKYYKPTEKSTDAYVAAIDLAVAGGAKIIVTPGFLFEPAIFQAQDMYPDVSFILLDGFPQDGTYTEFRIEENVYSIFYAEEESGFLAGYAAVMDGYTKLGFMGGMAVPAVVRFGYGFAQGAEYAAEQMGIDMIELKYHYTGNFDATPENQTMAASWFGAGTEVIFAAGGKVGNSVMAAAEAAGGKVIGVDVDQSSESDTVITSAKKELAISVQQGLAGFYAGEFKGGVSETLDITVDAVGLPFSTSRFTTFAEADYNAIYAALVADSDGIARSILTDVDVDAADELPLSIVSLTVFK